MKEESLARNIRKRILEDGEFISNVEFIPEEEVKGYRGRLVGVILGMCLIGDFWSGYIVQLSILSSYRRSICWCMSRVHGGIVLSIDIHFFLLGYFCSFVI